MRKMFKKNFDKHRRPRLSITELNNSFQLELTVNFWQTSTQSPQHVETFELYFEPVCFPIIMSCVTPSLQGLAIVTFFKFVQLFLSPSRYSLAVIDKDNWILLVPIYMQISRALSWRSETVLNNGLNAFAILNDSTENHIIMRMLPWS